MLIRFLIIFTMFVAYTCRESKEDREKHRLKQEEIQRLNADRDTTRQDPADTLSEIQETQSDRTDAANGRDH